MIQNFRSYELAVQIYGLVRDIKCPRHLKDQLLRAASSIVLNLAEGTAKPTKKDRIKFYAIAFGSTREVQAIFALLQFERSNLPAKDLDHLAACVYKLVYKQ